MATWKEVNQVWDGICEELGDIPCKLVREFEFKKITGHGLRCLFGRSNRRHNIIAVRFQKESLETIKNTLWHEVGHILFPKEEHWWIYCFGDKMSGWIDGGYWKVKEYNVRDTSDGLPKRMDLLELAKQANKKINKEKK